MKTGGVGEEMVRDGSGRSGEEVGGERAREGSARDSKCGGW